MRTNTIDFTGDPLMLRTANGGLTVSIPIRIRRYGGRKQVVVPQGISTGLSAVSAPTALQVALARGHRDRKSTRLNSSHSRRSRMPSSA